MKFNKKLLPFLLIFLLALSLRLPGLGDFMTVDETNWMMRSELFYDKMMRLDPGGTFMTTHPGATVMWLAGAGITAQEFRFGQELDQDNIIHFRKAAVFPIVFVISILIALVSFFLVPLLGRKISLISGVLLAASPYLVGMSQVVHLDAMQSLLMLASLLLFFNKKYLWAGVFAGLAMGIKFFLALWLPIIFLVILLLRKTKWQQIVRLTAFTGGVAVLTMWFIWPAMWVKDDIGQSFTRDAGNVVSEEHVQLTNADNEKVSSNTFYLRTWLGRIPPHIQILSLATIVFVLLNIKKTKKEIPAILTLYALGFLILITFAAKKADRYAMPALVVFPVLSAWAVDFALNKTNNQNIKKYLLPITALAVIALPLLWTPHAIAYNNPLFKNVRPLSQQGWGEGLEAAAAWLNENPLAQDTYVSSWYPSVMKTYFTGKTFGLSSREDLRVGFVVTYRNMMGRDRETQASDVLDEFSNDEPVHVVEIGGQPYAWIYKTVNVGHYTTHVGELLPGVEVGQEVTATSNEISAVEVGFATFSSRDNTNTVTVHVRDSATATTDLRTATISAEDIVDNEWHPIEFDSLSVEPGQQLYVSLTSADAVTGNAVTVRFVERDIEPGQMTLRRGPLKAGETNADFYREADAAIRIKED